MSKHQGVSCDSCHKNNFQGKRYKCLICYDYDLCSDCYRENLLLRQILNNDHINIDTDSNIHKESKKINKLPKLNNETVKSHDLLASDEDLIHLEGNREINQLINLFENSSTSTDGDDTIAFSSSLNSELDDDEIDFLNSRIIKTSINDSNVQHLNKSNLHNKSNDSNNRLYQQFQSRIKKGLKKQDHSQSFSNSNERKENKESGINNKKLSIQTNDLFSNTSSSSHGHDPSHPMQCILTITDYDICYGSESSARHAQSFVCPFCARLGFSEKQLYEHIVKEHPKSKREIVCPICAGNSGRDPHCTTDDFPTHFNLEHKSISRDIGENGSSVLPPPVPTSTTSSHHPSTTLHHSPLTPQTDSKRRPIGPPAPLRRAGALRRAVGPTPSVRDATPFASLLAYIDAGASNNTRESLRNIGGNLQILTNDLVGRRERGRLGERDALDLIWSAAADGALEFSTLVNDNDEDFDIDNNIGPSSPPLTTARTHHHPKRLNELLFQTRTPPRNMLSPIANPKAVLSNSLSSHELLSITNDTNDLNDNSVLINNIQEPSLYDYYYYDYDDVAEVDENDSQDEQEDPSQEGYEIQEEETEEEMGSDGVEERKRKKGMSEIPIGGVAQINDENKDSGGVQSSETNVGLGNTSFDYLNIGQQQNLQKLQNDMTRTFKALANANFSSPLGNVQTLFNGANDMERLETGLKNESDKESTISLYSNTVLSTNLFKPESEFLSVNILQNELNRFQLSSIPIDKTNIIHHNQSSTKNAKKIANKNCPLNRTRNLASRCKIAKRVLYTSLTLPIDNLVIKQSNNSLHIKNPQDQSVHLIDKNALVVKQKRSLSTHAILNNNLRNYNPLPSIPPPQSPFKSGRSTSLNSSGGSGPYRSNRIGWKPRGPDQPVLLNPVSIHYNYPAITSYNKNFKRDIDFQPSTLPFKNKQSLVVKKSNNSHQNDNVIRSSPCRVLKVSSCVSKNTTISNGGEVSDTMIVSNTNNKNNETSTTHDINGNESPSTSQNL
ncbi:GATA zinc finger domain-containing protein 14-like isoform X2 [Gordionus sp. m RMFG-2023]|uniref:GATA zinc finger domain-containing protein 14-like isoform X2 n=1 Tax=Gordionus sp. m RMFG-2023 TaxID=3053472 RepID=UPI0031FD11E1